MGVLLKIGRSLSQQAAGGPNRDRRHESLATFLVRNATPGSIAQPISDDTK